MNKLSKEKRDKLILTCLGAGGIIAVLYFFVISDFSDEMNSYQAKITTLKDKRDKADKLVKRQADFASNLEAQRKALNAKQADMPKPGQDVRWFQAIMEDRRVKYNLDIGDIRNPENWDPGILPAFQFKGIALNVTLIGAYADFGRFVADFENSYPYMRVQLLNILPEGQANLNPALVQSRPAAGQDGRLVFNFRVISLVKTQT